MKRMKLTPAGRAVAFVLIAALVIGGVYTAYKFFAPAELIEDFQTDVLQNFEKKEPVKQISEKTTAKKSEVAQPVGNAEPVINLSLDEWVGWKPLVDAAGGLTTQPGSIFDRLGVKVNIHIINDADSSSNALIKGDLNAAGYTLNRTAFLSGKFADAGLDVVMPVFTNYSNGGDGIIAMSNIQSVEDLVDAKIGVPRFSEAQSLVVWFINKSDLTDAQKQKVIDNLVMLDDAEQTGQAFFAGSLDVAATWQPYLSNAENSTNSHILFDTTSSNKLILDGILFRSDFAEKYPDIVSKFIEGIFMAEEMYTTDFSAIRKVMPMFADSSDDEIRDMCGDAGLMGYAENIAALEDDCPVVYADMCSVWESIGETVNRSLGASLFDASYVGALSDRYSSLIEPEKVVITDEQKEAALDVPSMLTKSCTIEFYPDTTKFMDNAEAAKILDEFVDIAKVLDGTIIQIEGNLNYAGGLYSGDALSTGRAKTVKNYFVACGIDPNRIVVVGNGNSNMLVDPNGSTAETMVNRRTDVFFKAVGA